MMLEVCDRCHSQWQLIDIVGAKIVLCRECFIKEHPEFAPTNPAPWILKFYGDLQQFGTMITWLKLLPKSTGEPLP